MMSNWLADWLLAHEPVLLPPFACHASWCWAALEGHGRSALTKG